MTEKIPFRVLSVFCFLLCCTATSTHTACPAPQSGYDVVLLAGQSNMVGVGRGEDNAEDAAISPRVWQWDPNSCRIVPAQDPLFQNQTIPNAVGLGMTFAKAYLKNNGGARNVLLVGSAANSTSFVSGRWRAPNGDLARAAVQRANEAIAAAGPGSRFAGVLWLQGEGDITERGAASYSASLLKLISYFRTNIKSATVRTPFVAGEMNYSWLASQAHDPILSAQQNTVLNVFHTLPDQVPYSAWVSSAGLPSDEVNGIIHFSALAQRQLGKRYADKFFEADNNLPQPQISQKLWSGSFVDAGRGLLTLDHEPTNHPPAISGTVSLITDPIHGEVAEIVQARGYLTYLVPGDTFNASYSKMVWFKPNSTGYMNNLISANNRAQSHFLLASTLTGGNVLILGGHSAGPLQIDVAAQVAATIGHWMNIALVYSAGDKTMTVYLNGARVSMQSHIAPAPPSNDQTVPVLMGGVGRADASGADGDMTGNRVWNVALTSGQVSALYRHERSERAGF